MGLPKLSPLCYIEMSYARLISGNLRVLLTASVLQLLGSLGRLGGLPTLAIIMR